MALRMMAIVLVMMVGAVLPRPVAAQAVGAQAVRVVVDGQVVAFDRPPAVIAGRLLIPLRGVFERLGAQVEWHPDPGRVVARHGATVVVLQLGNRYALVDGRQVMLDVPPVVLGGRTLVPLRFVGEALGAGVNWDSVGRVVYVTSQRPAALPPAPAPRPAPVPPWVPAPPPAGTPEPIRPLPIIPPTPQPALTVVDGTVAQVDLHTVPARLYVSADGLLWRFAVTAATGVFLTEVSTGRGGATSLDQIRRGDLVRVTADPTGLAVSVRASHRGLSGRLEGLGQRVLVLTDGQTLRVADEATFFLDGRETARDLLRQGMEVYLRINPQTGDVWEIRARTPTPSPYIPPVYPVPPPRLPPVYPSPPRIDGVSVSDRGPLGVGATLIVTLRGTPGGTAWFDVGRLERGVSMAEGPSGIYTGRYTVRAGEAALQAAVTAHLRLAGSETSRAGNPVAVDGLPPEFTRRIPEPGAVVAERQPMIILGLADRGPAGIDQGSLRLWVNGREVHRVEITETSAQYTPAEPLPFGRNQVQARIADYARNESTTSWTFTVELTRTPPPPPPTPRPTPTLTPGPAPPPRIDGVSVSDRGPLGVGATLVVTLRGTPGGTARFDVGRLERDVSMAEGPSGIYTGRYTVRAGEAALQAAVTAYLRLAGSETSRAGDPVTVDGLPPEFTRRIPEPGAVVAERQPMIVLGLADRGPAGIDQGSLRLWVNGREVRRVAITETGAQYTPAEPLPIGQNRVQARIADFARNESTTSWTFAVELPRTPPPPPPTPRPTPTLTPGPTPRPTHTLTPGPTPPVVSPPSPSPPAVSAPPVIVAPRPGEAVVSPLLVRGTAAGAERVHVTVEYGRGRVDGRTEVVGPISTTPTSSGAWEVLIRLTPPPRPGDRVTITAVAVSSAGVRSEPARLVIVWPEGRQVEGPGG
ncbi:MAG: copper amine oxidase N-terminal domain-containing protein [bacterium]|nr:copper amine oxidase N-terminal domain-containing protein [bacterium]